MTVSRALKDSLYEQVARLAGAMASPKRLELIELLCQCPKSVETLAAQAEISVKLASAHLKSLRHARIVEVEKRGRHAIYRLASPDIASLLVVLRTIASDRLFELKDALRRLADPDLAWRATDGAALLRKARRGEVVVLDVRPAEEFDARHLPSARSLPLAELRKRLSELPQDRPIVAYCRGPYCLMSIEAVKQLRRAGLEAYHWTEGAADWLSADSAGAGARA